MSKLNIPFNNKNYNIDEAALSAALAELRQHLSTVMNGTGAKIVLGGTAYNIDSTKLSTATAEFVTHLGTVAGSGYKVNVNGVEYGVASDKMAGAVADLEAVLGGLNSGGGGSANLPEIGISAEDCTWEEITAISAAGKAEEYFNLGDTKTVTLTDGTVVEMQIVAFNADDKADGSGKAAITWISKGVVTKRIMSSNPNNTNWENSELRDWLQNDFYATLPSDVQGCIVTVNKTYAHHVNLGSGNSAYEQDTCEDNVWIPSYREIYGNSSNDIQYETSGADYTAFFKDYESCIKYNSEGIDETWWLRTICSYGSNGYFVTWGGYPSYYGVHYQYGVVPCFCTGATSSTPEVPTEDELLEGDGQEFHKFAPTALTFRSTAPLNELQEVQINGVTVDPSNYTTEEGSTIITLPIEYLKTLDVDNYEITVVSDSKSAKGGFSVYEPELNEYGFYYNQPYTAYVSMLGAKQTFFLRDDGNVDVINLSTGSLVTGTFTCDGKNASMVVPIGTLTGTWADDGKSIYCNELQVNALLGDESIVADEYCLYIYRENLGGYEVVGINKDRCENVAIKTDINGCLTISIGQEAFDGFLNLTNIAIPRGVKNINSAAFAGTSLTSVTIPDSVVNIGLWLFSSCSSLKNITFEGTVAQWNAITKGEGWNYNVPATYVQCSDGQVSLV